MSFKCAAVISLKEKIQQTEKQRGSWGDKARQKVSVHVYSHVLHACTTLPHGHLVYTLSQSNTEIPFYSYPPYLISHRICIIVSCDMPVLHVDAQSEQLQKFESERQELVNTRQRIEDSWISLACADLTEESVKEKLEEVRKSAQTNLFLQQIHDANKDVVSKTAEFDKVKQDLESMQPELDKVDTTLKEHISHQNENHEQVCPPT